MHCCVMLRGSSGPGPCVLPCRRARRATPALCGVRCPPRPPHPCVLLTKRVASFTQASVPLCTRAGRAARTSHAARNMPHAMPWSAWVCSVRPTRTHRLRSLKLSRSIAVRSLHEDATACACAVRTSAIAACSKPRGHSAAPAEAAGLASQPAHGQQPGQALRLPCLRLRALAPSRR